MFIPFLSQELTHNFFTSIDLYFRNFEFNASIYYIVREIGFSVKGYNIIQTAGSILSVITFVIILVLAFLRKNRDWKDILVSMLFATTVYYLLATTVHPWYIATLLSVSVFTRFRFAVAWSILLITSYYTYQTNPPEESSLLLIVEYGIVYGFIFYELLNKRYRLS